MLINSPVINSRQDGDSKKTILIICGLSPSQPAYRFILGGIREKLTEEFSENYSLHTEYLEIENYPQDNYPEERFNIYNEKYRAIKLDLLIVVGRKTIGVLKKNAENYLINLPAISIDFDFSEFGYPSDISLNEQTVVIGLRMPVDRMISTAISVFPQTSSLYFIGGSSKFDRFMTSLAQNSVQKIDHPENIIYMTDYSMDSILQQVKKLPSESLIFIPSFTTDGKNVTYYNDESVRLISNNSNAPVFAYSDMGLGEGAIGGYILRFKNVGLIAGETAVRILKGADPNSIKINPGKYYESVFDWRELKRWNLINSELLPKNSTIIYEDISFIDRYKWVVGLVLLFLVLQSILIANFIRLNRNQKIMTSQIIEAQNKYKEFLHEDRSLRLGQLTASLSHEIAQPLTAILSNAQAGINFINSNQATPELLKDILQKIVESDKRTASIINSIKGLLKVENREKEKVDLNSLIDEILQIYKNEANQQDIEINFNSSLQPIYILADRVQIQQVILNLIINASQSLEKVDAKRKMITIFQSIDNQNVIVSLSDNGGGIDEALKENIFKPFSSNKLGGMGIGLAICRTIIDDHFGEIWAENLPEGGAKFSFSLKVIKDE